MLSSSYWIFEARFSLPSAPGFTRLGLDDGPDFFGGETPRLLHHSQDFRPSLLSAITVRKAAPLNHSVDVLRRAAELLGYSPDATAIRNDFT